MRNLKRKIITRQFLYIHKQSVIKIYRKNILEINPNEESLYANRSLCYRNLSKFKLSLYDLNRAIEITPRNIKYLKRLANLQMIYGNFGDSFNILTKCSNLEPREYEHKKDLEDIQKKINVCELIEEKINKGDFIKAEELAEKIIKECTLFFSMKITYVKCLIENLKLLEAINYILTFISEDEKNDEIDYLLALSFYYDGQ